MRDEMEYFTYDQDQLSEIDLATDLMIAAQKARAHLTVAAIDDALGLVLPQRGSQVSEGGNG